MKTIYEQVRSGVRVLLSKELTGPRIRDTGEAKASPGAWKLQQTLAVSGHRCNDFLNPLCAAVSNPKCPLIAHSIEHGRFPQGHYLRENPAFMCAGALRACGGPGTSR